MGAVNYKTSKYITLGIKPYDVNDTIEAIKNDPEDFNVDEADLEDEDYLYDKANDLISELYDDDETNVEYILKNHDFEYFDVTLEPGYYEGFTIDIDPLFDFYVDEAKSEALAEVDDMEKMLKELAGVGMVACYPGWGTGYEDYNGTLNEIKSAVEEMKNDINNTEISESMHRSGLMEASVYSAKLNQFLDGCDPEIVKWVKKVLNNIFLGIKDDFEGYREGKRPTIKSYGTYKLFKMVIQAESDVKKNSNDVPGKWNFHDPVKDYCSSLGKIFDKKIDGDTYQCVAYNHKEDLENAWSNSDYANLTSQSVYPMIGCYHTGIGGSYKNLTKEIPGTTYSIVVSIPETDNTDYSNPFMTKQGNTYKFENDVHTPNDYKFTVTYDMSDNEFTVRNYKQGDPETFTAVYNKGRNGLKAFKELVNSFSSTTTESEAERILHDHGIKVKHSWWFNPYYD